MSVTVISQPQEYTPAYSPAWWRASSTQTAQPNFKYLIKVTDVLTGTEISELVDARPNGECWYNSNTIAEAYINQVTPEGLYGWQLNTNAVRRVKVNIGEYYDVSGTNTYFAGSDIYYYIWNGVLNFREYPEYDYLDYIYAGNNIQLITNNHNPNWVWSNTGSNIYYSNDEKCADNRSSYLYFHADNLAGYPEILRITGFTYSGVSVFDTYVTNPYQASTTYTDKYLFIDVGYNGLVNMPSGQCTGTYPMNPAACDYWIIRDYSSWLPSSGGRPRNYPLKRIDRFCEPRYDIITLHYLSKPGSFETFNFSKLSERSMSMTSTSYGKYPYQLVGSDISYYTNTGIRKVLNVNETNRIKVTSDWITEEESTRLKELVTSPIIYMDAGDGWISVNMVTNSYSEKKKYNEKLISVQFDIEYNFNNWSQRG